MKRLAALLTAFTLPATQAREEEKADADYIRVVENETECRLETSVIRFEKDGVSVELLGAIHIADAAYYDQLEKRFESYDALLYEGIGNPFPKTPRTPELEPVDGPAEGELTQTAKPKGGNLQGLHSVYQKGADWLGLSYQMQEIDYGRENFVHADLTHAEFVEAQGERNESLLSFLVKASIQQPETKAKEPNTIRLVKALWKKDKNLLKREFVHTLGAGDDQIAALAGDSVIVSDRNEKCLEVLGEQIALGKKKIGIFYGAAHFPDMESRLTESGWTRTSESWLTAWDLDG